MAISSVSSSSYLTTASSTVSRAQRPGPKQMVEDLFAKVDTGNQGYIDKSSLKTALDSTSADGTDTSADVEALFRQFDADSDGKITKSEMSSGMDALASQLNAQFDQSRMQMPPPPSADDIFSSIDADSDGSIDVASLQSALEANGSTNAATEAANLLKAFDSDGDSKISKSEFSTGFDALMQPNAPADGAAAAGGAALQAPGGAPPPRTGAASGDSESESTTTVYDAADTNEDGTVSLQELVAYTISQSEKAATTSGASDSSSDQNGMMVMKMITQLMESYGRQSGFDQSTTSSTSSTSRTGSSLTATA